MSSCFFTHVMTTDRLRQDLRGKSHQLLISREQHGRISASQSQIEAVDHRVIQMTRQYQRFHLKVPVGFDVIYKCNGPTEALLQTFGLQLVSFLKPPESIGHFGEHQLRGQNQFSVVNRLLEGSCLNAPCPRGSALPKMAQMRHHHALPPKQRARQEPVDAAHADRHHRPPANPSGLACSNCGETAVPVIAGADAAGLVSRGFGGWLLAENSRCMHFTCIPHAGYGAQATPENRLQLVRELEG